MWVILAFTPRRCTDSYHPDAKEVRVCVRESERERQTDTDTETERQREEIKTETNKRNEGRAGDIWEPSPNRGHWQQLQAARAPQVH